MFKYTTAAISVILKEVRKWIRILDFLFIFFMLAYFAYTFIMSVGILYVNIALLISYAVYIIYRFSTANKEKQQEAKKKQKLFAYCMRGITLASSLYAIYIAGADSNGIAIIMSVLTLVLWVFETFVRLIAFFIESKQDLVISAIHMDIEPFVKAYNRVAFEVDKIELSINEEHRIPLKAEADERETRKEQSKKEKRDARMEEIKRKVLRR